MRCLRGDFMYMIWVCAQKTISDGVRTELNSLKFSFSLHLNGLKLLKCLHLARLKTMWILSAVLNIFDADPGSSGTPYCHILNIERILRSPLKDMYLFCSYWKSWKPPLMFIMRYYSVRLCFPRTACPGITDARLYISFSWLKLNFSPTSFFYFTHLWTLHCLKAAFKLQPAMWYLSVICSVKHPGKHQFSPSWSHPSCCPVECDGSTKAGSAREWGGVRSRLRLGPCEWGSASMCSLLYLFFM